MTREEIIKTIVDRACDPNRKLFPPSREAALEIAALAFDAGCDECAKLCKAKFTLRVHDEFDRGYRAGAGACLSACRAAKGGGK